MTNRTKHSAEEGWPEVAASLQSWLDALPLGPATPLQPPMTDPRIIALSSNPGQAEPGPFSEHDLREQWNAQADEFNQWESLDSSEQLAWAQTRAIAADRFLPPVAKPTPVDLAELHDPDFSNGLTASQHLDVVRGGPDPRVTATPALPPRVGHILRLAEIIREMDGKHDLGAAALAEAILAHPGFSGCHDGPAALPAPEAGETSGLSDEYLVRVYQQAYEPALKRGEAFGCHWDGLRAVYNLGQKQAIAIPKEIPALPAPGFQIGPQEYVPDIRPASEAQGVLADRYEFSVLDNDDCEQAGGSAPTLDDLIREGRNYLRQYNQDGPHKLELRRVHCFLFSEATHDHA